MRVALVMGLAGMMLAGNNGCAQAVTAVPQLDLNKFLGEWYEVARLPGKADKKCVASAFSLYAAKDKARHYSQVNSCLDQKRVAQIQNVDGVQDKSGNGRLRVRYFVLLHHTYEVLGMAPDGAWAVMGTPNHKQLWVLSRASNLGASELAAARGTAAAAGFDVGKLEMVAQQVSEQKAVVVSATTP